MADPIRIANCSGFYGDRLAAAQEMVSSSFGRSPAPWSRSS